MSVLSSWKGTWTQPARKGDYRPICLALEMLSGISNVNLSQVKPGLHTEGSGRNDFTLTPFKIIKHLC